MDVVVTLLSTLAASQLLDDLASPLESFHARASESMRMLDSWLVLSGVAEPGRQLVNTRLFFGAPLPPMPASGPHLQALESGRPVIVGPFTKPSLGIPVVAVAVPVLRDGIATGVLSAPLDRSRLGAILREQRGARAGASVFLLSSDMQVIARTTTPRRDAPAAIPAALQAAIGHEASGLVRAPDLLGRDSVIAFQRIERTNWILGVREPAEGFEAAWLDPALQLLFTATALLAAGVLAAGWQARRLARPLRRLVSGQPSGGRNAGLAARVREFEELELSVRRMEEALRREAANAARAAAANLQIARDAEDDRSLLSSVMQSVPDPIFVKDLSLRYVLINKAGAAVVGRAIEDVVGRSDADIFPPDVAETFGRSDRAVLDMDMFREQEERAVDGTGREIWLSTVKGPWRDSRGEVAGLLGVARDITERKATARRLADAEAAMRRIARADSMAAMGVGLAHELNQPLTAATNFLRAAIRLSAGTPPEARRLQMAREAMDEASSQMVRAGQIIHRLRDFISRGETERQRVDLGALALESVALARAARGEDAASVPVVFDGRHHRVIGDPVQLQQVLVNLLRNALEATEHEAAPRVILRVHRADGEIRLGVEDNGPGIPPGVMERLFEPFQSTKPDGMGVGLSICRAIVEAHHGRLEAMPIDAGGTLMLVSLPEAA